MSLSKIDNFSSSNLCSMGSPKHNISHPPLSRVFIYVSTFCLNVSIFPGQENAANLLENTADFVSSQLSSGTADTEVLQKVGASLLYGISNVMNAASTGAKQEEGDEKEGAKSVLTEEIAKETNKDEKKDNKDKVQCFVYCMTLAIINWEARDREMEAVSCLGVIIMTVISYADKVSD